MWYWGHAEDVLGELGGDLSSGLSENECRLRLGTCGLNRLTGRKKKSTLRLFLEQLNSMLILFLIGALQIGVITVAPLADLFRVVPLSVSDWLVVAVLSVIPIVCNEIVKIVVRRSVT